MVEPTRIEVDLDRLHGVQLAEFIGATLSSYFHAISTDAKSNSLYARAMKEIGFESTIKGMADGFCKGTGVTNKEFNKVLEQLLRMY